MATGYELSIGYLSGYSTDQDCDEAWESFKKAALDIADHPERIVEEARRFDAPEECDEGCCTLERMAERYAKRDDLTLQFIEGEQLSEGQSPYIYQMATGDRELKEHVRRAFCRLVIYEMHRQGIEVNLVVS